MLTRFLKRYENHDSEAGVALLSVVITSIVVMLALVTLGHFALASITQTSTLKNNTAALRAADSGLDEALANVLFSAECEAAGTDAEVNFEYQVYHSDFELQAPHAENMYGAQTGCPEPSDRWLVIVSTGISGAHELQVTSVYEWNEDSLTPSFDENGDYVWPVLISREEQIR